MNGKGKRRSADGGVCHTKRLELARRISRMCLPPRSVQESRSWTSVRGSGKRTPWQRYHDETGSPNGLKFDAIISNKRRKNGDRLRSKALKAARKSWRPDFLVAGN